MDLHEWSEWMFAKSVRDYPTTVRFRVCGKCKTRHMQEINAYDMSVSYTGYDISNLGFNAETCLSDPIYGTEKL